MHACMHTHTCMHESNLYKPGAYLSVGLKVTLTLEMYRYGSFGFCQYLIYLYQIVLMPIAELIFHYICYEFILQIIDMVKISISAADILANPIIGTPLINIILE